MAPIKAPIKTREVSATPLAEYFWIAGLDGSEILETFQKLGEVKNTNGSQAPPVADTIEEDEDAEAEHGSITESPRPMSRSEKRNSYQRLSKLSNEARISTRSIDSGSRGGNSNRSSATIRAVPNTPSLLNDVDFEVALRRFAAERDSFLSDLSLSAGAVVPNRPKPRPKTQKIVAEDGPAGLRSGIGSVRRHMSFREMSSMKRQPSLARQGQCSTKPLPASLT